MPVKSRFISLIEMEISPSIPYPKMLYMVGSPVKCNFFLFLSDIRLFAPRGEVSYHLLQTCRTNYFLIEKLSKIFLDSHWKDFSCLMLQAGDWLISDCHRGSYMLLVGILSQGQTHSHHWWRYFIVTKYQSLLESITFYTGYNYKFFTLM